MIDTVLHLHLLNEDMAVFMGESEETKEYPSFFGGTQEAHFKFPSFQLSRQMWKDYEQPTCIRISVTNDS
jgi:hypothetical protein